jgi:acetyl-CoA C-acetyltransferase
MDDLRARPGERGLVWANGGFATKHAFGVYSTEPPTAGFRHGTPQGEVDAMPRRELVVGDAAAGPATVEAYTVSHDRDGAPERAIATCLLANGGRAWGDSTDPALMTAMLDGEWVGATVTLTPEGELRV